ncbi:hypothetical protein A3E72_00040 [Candidatus Gottesmanbacteria bacterium RIFCSPHIGHO2_12_FULL_43_26]|uniref:Uncharacterized protein n=1 Tax=Candidatus Gottesmanbacteria bacterium RIFCSPLOWO2_01_FULL_42_22 TaxID=1798391 RepID=A0A1F6BK59_9BACT|nr:MAG: hypothetical protein A3E72_00040 [Candidatus Gottesmanbacteria bacterium RIFCSPHIGHO2_12_FULL_43_26]OGG34064.1 MAG: hypothetical protein A3G68_04325 [Candidatus Gottesmanbacteria bacterium RIFCSPLOWO2_12_FULL_42_10]OGG37290.1 MAG: hypothetical protein A2968_00410 [Candidatus Gottesmanbacteria bacterium RIFCSPLOWO2_01_FULL_42_22]
MMIARSWITVPAKHLAIVLLRVTDRSAEFFPTQNVRVLKSVISATAQQLVQQTARKAQT